MSLRGDIVTERLTANPLPAGAATPRAVLTTEDGVILAYGSTFPADATVGYAPGCIFIHTDASGSAWVYINEGTKASSAFAYVAAGT